ncbi:MAG: TonB-dependent receptor plug domain-containing protein [Pseudomonadales bacterium]|nr:TonB-dependent receptor plug domain-containing protein [Pseudomonadales bacterium]
MAFRNQAVKPYQSNHKFVTASVHHLNVIGCFFLVIFSLNYSASAIAQHEEELEEIVVTSTRTRRSFENQPTRVEVLGGEEINEKANMKPGDIRMLLNESTGIYVQQTSATSFNSSIRIQGLDGKYTQILRDSMPLYGGYSGGLSLLQIAPLDLQQVEVIKGSNSTLFGGGAIAGLVNLVTRGPGAEPENSFLLNATSADGIDASGFFSRQNDNVGATLFTSYNASDAYDPADNGFSAIPEFERWTIKPRLFLEGENSETTMAISLVTEDRLGGDMNYIDGRRSNPAYFEDSDTSRISTQFERIQYSDSGNELVLRNSVSRFDRELTIPGFEFGGTQLSSFSEVHILGANENLDWVLGINLWTEDFEQDNPLPGFSQDFSSHTIGAFAQATLPLSNRWMLESGIRFDHNSEYGSFILPRVSLLYNLSDDTTLRIGGGLGYKEPTLFTEESEALQFLNVLPLNEDQLDAEQSAGLNIDINRSFEFDNGISLNLNALVFYTRVDDPLQLELVAPNQYAFSQPQDYLDSKGTEINAAWFWNDFKLFLGYTHTDVEEHGPAGVSESTLIPEDRVNTVFVYEREDDFRIGLEAYYFGQQALTDGSRGRDYWIFGLMMEKVFTDQYSLFLNFENFTDTRQTRYEQIYSGTLTDPMFNDIFAPLDGFVINGGIKLRL